MSQHHRPGFEPAMRILTGTTATEEQRRVAKDLIGEDDDLLWAAPGTRRLSKAEIASIGMGRPPVNPDQWDWIDDNRGARMLGWVTIGLLIIGGVTATGVLVWKIGQWWGAW